MILIAGATGSNGSELARLLSSRGIRVRAMVRSRESAKSIAALPGVELVLADFDDQGTVERALDGIEKAFLVTNSSERAEAQQRAFIETAGRAGLKHIVKLSQFAASENSPVRFLRYHAAVERAIVEAGITYTFLRPNLFMQGLLAFRASIIADGKFFAAAGDATVSVVDVRDNAAAAAAALTEPGHEGRIYDLTGPQVLTHTEMAAYLSAAIGRSITFINVSSDAMREALLRVGLPPWQVDGLVEDYAHYRRGEASAVTSGVLDATGQPPRTFAAFARDYASEFS
ncbi:MAG: SDR family oxidoreductase [Deltaproteobacteria bacterium]|nr:SDR family oxidoreductase [Deltaproteobacteria bacterium]